MRKILDWIFEQFQRNCPHDPSYVSADILEGSGRGEAEVKWCRRCGAYQIHYMHGGTFNIGKMTPPHATWPEKPKHPISWEEYEKSRPESWGKFLR